MSNNTGKDIPFHTDMENSMTLFVLAAGLGSRYGGLKQLDPMTPHGEFIIDFSIFDAIRAGFDHVVFIIKKENYDVFRETIGARIENKIKVDYAFQAIDKLVPADKIPEGRVKPWGTFHALLCAKEYLNEPFAVINADDFYGADAYKKVADFLCGVAHKDDNRSFAMVGYRLGNTLTDAGSVARGVCETKNGILTVINERAKVFKDPDGAHYEDENGASVPVSPDTPVSMNFWGFTPDFFKASEKYFGEFLNAEHKDPLKAECYLPVVVGEMIKKGECEVSVLQTTAKWYGVTYLEDKPGVVAKIHEMIESGEYPDGLWK